LRIWSNRNVTTDSAFRTRTVPKMASAVRKVRMTAPTMPGRIWGSVTYRNVCQGVAPSARAAASASVLTSAYVPRRRKVARGTIE
jgi:hypothetical protein